MGGDCCSSAIAFGTVFLLAFGLGYGARSWLRRWRRGRTLVPFDALRALYRPRGHHGSEGPNELHPEAHEQVVHLFHSAEDFDRTLALLEGWLDEDPHADSLLAVLAFAHYKAGDDERSLPFVKRALDVEGKNPYLHYLHGLVEFRRGNVEIAVQAWERVIRLRPDHKVALDAQRRIEGAGDAIPPEPA